MLQPGKSKNYLKKEYNSTPKFPKMETKPLSSMRVDSKNKSTASKLGEEMGKSMNEVASRLIVKGVSKSIGKALDAAKKRGGLR